MPARQHLTITLTTSQGTHQENPTGTIQRNGKPFVEGDLENLPFEDGAFDFVHASHVMEHVSPKKAIAELERVASRGYIECPRAWFEMVDSSPFHNWMIEFANGALEFRPKPKILGEFTQSRRLFDVHRNLFLQFYGGILDGVDEQMAVRRFEKHVCHICVYWEHIIPYRMLSAPQFQN